MITNYNIQDDYLTPAMEVVEVAIEAGFANSIEDPIENPEQEW